MRTLVKERSTTVDVMPALCFQEQTLTGLPTTQSSVNDGRTSSFSNSEMSYEKEETSNYQTYQMILFMNPVAMA